MQKPFGSLFSENIVRENHKRNRFSGGVSERYSFNIPRIIILGILLLFGLGILFARLFTLTLIDGGRYRHLSEGNRIRETVILAPRGIIYDRNKKPLVRNIPYFKSQKEIFFENKPSSVSSDMDEGITREYLFGSAMAHVLGYVGSVTEMNPGYSPQDLIGKMGIEKVYDQILRGQNGKELEEVDALGNTVRVLGRVEPTEGKSVYLVMDNEIQQTAASLMDKYKGAVVVSDPRSGAILAIYSSPGFNPNDFVRGTNLPGIFSNPDNPLFDRAISGTYPPGSTFKIITSLAALTEGVITPQTQIEDSGILSIGSFSFGNWYYLQYGRKDGFLNVVGALKRSNDIFFYKTGEALGVDKLAAFARKFGLGDKLGIDLPEEAQGLMPDTKWTKEVKGENWYLGNTYHIAIGQGDLLTTPLQVNAWTNTVANGGMLCKPYLLAGQKIRCIDLGINPDYIGLVREGMKEACLEGGTGWPLFGFKVTSEKLKVDGVDFLNSPESTTSGKPVITIPVACKTGTAEYGDPRDKTHAWFTAFAPVHNPQISVTVLIEGGGEGSSVAGPLAKKILETWFLK